MGVPIFFMLSGYLIFMSLSKQRDWKSFLSKRVLRLYPELWLCLVLEILSIIIFFDGYVPLIDYLKFSFTQGTFFQFWTPDSLRPYGCGCPNGSLWTITVIVQFYFVIYVFFNKLRKAKFGIWLLLLIFAFAWDYVALPVVNGIVPEVVSKLLRNSILNHFWVFLIGALICRFSDVILPFLKKYWYVALLGIVISRISGIEISGQQYPFLKTLLLGLFIFGFAYAFPKLNINKDISYGVYIYHMVFVNVAIQLGYIKNWFVLGIVVLVSFLFAYLSYSIMGAFYRNKKRIIADAIGN